MSILQTEQLSCKARLLVASFPSFTWFLVPYFRQNKDTPPWFPCKLWVSVQPLESFSDLFFWMTCSTAVCYRSIIKCSVVLFTKIPVLIPACQCNSNSWLQHFLFAYPFPLTVSWETVFLLLWLLLSSIWDLVAFGTRVWVSHELGDMPLDSGSSAPPCRVWCHQVAVIPRASDIHPIA